MAETAAMPPNSEMQDGQMPANAEIQDGQMPTTPEMQNERSLKKLALDSNGMLLDGSNPEFVDPVPALEWKSKDDLTNAVLYGPSFSPPVTKLATILVFYRIPYTRIKGNKPDTPYNKVPVLMAGGRQVNDTTIILKNLVSAIGIEDFDPKWDYKIATVWDATFRKNCTASDCAKFAARFVVPCACMGGFLSRKIVKALREQYDRNSKANPDYISHPSDGFIEPCKEFRADFKGTFHGGETPDVVDLLAFGFLGPGVYAGMDMFISAIRDAGLREWNTKMQQFVPYGQLFYGTVVASE